MAGKQVTGDGLSVNFAGMSKNQLYEIMSQMKNLIEQNQDQAKEILIQNPLLTKALFQAQIMLGMVQPPQMIPKVEPPASQPPQPPVQPRQQPSSQPPPFSSQASFQDQTRKQPQNQQNLSLPIASTTIPSISIQPSSVASHSLQPPQPQMLYQNLPSTSMAIPQSSQLPNIPSVPLHSSTKVPPLQQPQMPPPISAQLQQPIPSSGVPLQLPPLQPPLPSQLRPPSMQQPYHHQYPPQIGPGGGFSHSGGPPQHGSQPMYHSALRPASSMGSFPQGQPPPSQQQLPQSMYQVGGASHSGSAEFSHHPGGPIQGDRGSSWVPGLSEPSQLPGPPPLAPPSQAGPTSQPPSLSPEMEKALLQQVMSLTQEQINLLPPEQRSQVLQLQQMLRQ